MQFLNLLFRMNPIVVTPLTPTSPLESHIRTLGYQSNNFEDDKSIVLYNTNQNRVKKDSRRQSELFNPNTSPIVRSPSMQGIVGRCCSSNIASTSAANVTPNMLARHYFDNSLIPIESQIVEGYF